MADRYTLTLGGLRVSWDAPHEGAVSLSLHGDLDNVTVPVLRQVLDTLYEQRCFVIRLDLSQLAFIDSSGLGALVGAWRHCKQEDGEVSASNPTVPVRRLMDMTGISTFLLTSA
jgi:anti-anti-sigma factor